MSQKRTDPLNSALSLLGPRLLLWVLSAAAYFPSIAIDLGNINGYSDAWLFFAHEVAARRTVLEYGEFPLWDPYACGGIPGMGNPQNTSMAPDFALRLIFGVANGWRLTLLLFFLVGLECVFHLSRQLGVSPMGSAFAAIVFNMSGFLAGVHGVGWINLLTYHLIPGVILCFERGFESWPWRCLGGVLLAWMILSGGTYPFPYTLVILGLLTAVRTAQALLNESNTGLDRVQPILTTLVMIGLGLALSSVRLLPLTAVVFGLPRSVPAYIPRYDSTALFGNLLFEVRDLISHPRNYYIGSIPLVLALVAWSAKAHSARLMAIVFFFFAMGNFAWWAPTNWLAQLPLFNQLRAHHRYMSVVTMYLALASGFGLMAIERLPGRLIERFRATERFHPLMLVLTRGLAGFVVICVILFVHNRLTENHGDVTARTYLEQLPLFDRTSDFKQARGNYRCQHYFGPLNRGNLSCLEATKFPQSRLLRADLAAEEYPLVPSHATVTRKKWTPNSIMLDVDATIRARVLINQNYHRYWRSNIGQVVDHDGLLAVDLPRGHHQLKLAYRDPFFYLGAAITSLTAIILLWACLQLVKRQLNTIRTTWMTHPWLPSRILPVDTQQIKIAFGSVAIMALPLVFYWQSEPASLTASYYHHHNFKGKPFHTRRVDDIDVEWIEQEPLWGMRKRFAIRWEGCLNVAPAQNPTLRMGADNGARVYIDGKLVIDNWKDKGYTEKSATAPLSPGSHSLRVDYFNRNRNAKAVLKWSTDGKIFDVVPPDSFSPSADCRP